MNKTSAHTSGLAHLDKEIVSVAHAFAAGKIGRWEADRHLQQLCKRKRAAHMRLSLAQIGRVSRESLIGFFTGHARPA